MQVSYSESLVWAVGKYMLYLKTECMWAIMPSSTTLVISRPGTKQPSVNIVYGSNIHLSWPPPSPHLGVECDMWYVETFTCTGFPEWFQLLYHRTIYAKYRPLPWHSWAWCWRGSAGCPPCPCPPAAGSPGWPRPGWRSARTPRRCSRWRQCKILYQM